MLKTAAIVIVLFFAAGSSSTAYAYTLWVPDGSGCVNGVRWPDDPSFEINVSEYDYDTPAKIVSVTEPMERIGAVNGAWIDPTWTTGTSSSLGNGDSEIWLSQSLPEGVLGETSLVSVSGQPYCQLFVVDIRMDAYTDWVWGTPSTYYDPVVSDDGGERYIRVIHMHELLHAMGLDHERDAFSNLLYWSTPSHALFTNRSSDKMVEPTPDDREGLRYLYPTETAERDMAVANLWVDPERYPGEQRKFCRPAKGFSWDTDIFASYCPSGIISTTNLCPGDTIYARFNVMNYGTSSENAHVEAWFSTNETWSQSDYESPSEYDVGVPAQTSIHISKRFQVPYGIPLNTTFHMIARSRPLLNPTEESTQNNWIPLRGTLRTKASCP
ncbi:MAG: hypothetical protein M5R36_10595 [Deltaproteobacteria bacterium]|nr:hypothetical protein [Deltaproteobacteria bacterium]